MSSAAKKLNQLAISDKAQLTRAIKRIGTLRSQIADLESEMNTEVAKIQGRLKGLIERRHAKMVKLEKNVAEYCLTFKGDLLSSGGKTAKFATGQVQFKKERPKVVLEMDEDLVIARLVEAQYNGAVRVRHSVDKNYVLAHPEIAERVKGLSIQEGKEAVVIKPTTAT